MVKVSGYMIPSALVSAEKEYPGLVNEGTRWQPSPL